MFTSRLRRQMPCQLLRSLMFASTSYSAEVCVVKKMTVILSPVKGSTPWTHWPSKRVKSPMSRNSASLMFKESGSTSPRSCGNQKRRPPSDYRVPCIANISMGVCVMVLVDRDRCEGGSLEPVVLVEPSRKWSEEAYIAHGDRGEARRPGGQPDAN